MVLRGSIFFINVPTAGIALLLVAFFVPTSRDSHINPLDLPGSFLSALGLTSLVYGLIQGPEFGWTDPIVIWAFIVSIVVTQLNLLITLISHDLQLSNKWIMLFICCPKSTFL